MKNESVKTLIIFFISAFLILLVLFTVWISLISSDGSLIRTSNKVNFVGYFSFDERIHILLILQNVKQDYFIDVNEINFVSDSNAFKHYCNDNGSQVTGCNNFQKYSNNSTYDKISIFTSNPNSDIKIALCHELLHNQFPRDEPHHAIVYSLSRQGVCYKNKK